MKANKKNKSKGKHAKPGSHCEPPTKKSEPAAASPITGGDKAVGNDDLRQVMKKIRETLQALETGDFESARSNYEIGEDVKEVTDNPEKFGIEPGRSAVNVIAEQVGFKKDTVYNGLKVAEAWPRKDFTAWLTKKGKNDFRLSFAHFVEAVKVDDPKERDAKLEEALTEGLSTRQLRKRCMKARREDGKPNRRVSGARLLASIIKLSEKCTTLFGQLPDALPAFDGAGVADPAGLVDRAQEVQHQVKELCEGNVKLLALKFQDLKLAAAGDDEELHTADVVPILGASKTEPVTSMAGGAA